MAALPKTVNRIAVLDRTKEAGSAAEPLYLDVLSAVTEHDEVQGHPVRRTVIGGRYGISGKEFTPGMVVSVFDNLALPNPKRHFTVRAGAGGGEPPGGGGALGVGLCAFSLIYPVPFQVGIVDDVTSTSLPLAPQINTLPPIIHALSCLNKLPVQCFVHA